MKRIASGIVKRLAVLCFLGVASSVFAQWNSGTSAFAWLTSNEHAHYACDVDTSGNIYLATVCTSPTPQGDIFIIKYNPAGAILFYTWLDFGDQSGNSWEDIHDSYFSSDDETWIMGDLCVDSNQNIYIAATSRLQAPSSDYDICAAKYTYVPGGLNGGYPGGPSKLRIAEDGVEVARGIAVDESGNMYITGVDFEFGELNVIPHLVLCKVVNMSVNWQMYRYANFRAYDIAYRSGHVFVTGRTTITDPSSDLFLFSVASSNGSYEWSQYYGAWGEGENAYGMAVDGSGNIGIAGTWANGLLAAKFGPTGSLIWTSKNIVFPGQSYPGICGGWASNVDFDSSGNLFLTGWAGGSGSISTTSNAWDSLLNDGLNSVYLDNFLMRFSPSGTLLLSTYLNGSEYGNVMEDLRSTVACFGSTVYIGGNTYQTGYNSNPYVTKVVF
jgi:hypothetical protein